MGTFNTDITEEESRLWIGAAVRDERAGLAEEATSPVGGRGLKGRIVDPGQVDRLRWTMITL